MHLFFVAFIVSGVLFALLDQPWLILYFFSVVVVYMVLSVVLPKAKNISNRKKFMVGSWSNPSEGVIQMRLPCRTEKVEEVISRNTSG
jgi:ABC-type protease/lipase transport system fused ATPase/permease subunit